MINDIFNDIDISALNKDNILNLFLTKDKKLLCSVHIQTTFLKKYPKLYNFMYNYFDDIEETDTVITVLYRIIYDVKLNPVCPICGNRLRVVRFNKGFLLFCSKSCINKSKEVRDKIKNTCMSKYGVDNAAKNKKVQNKIIKTNVEKYGCSYGFLSDIIKDKIRNTCLRKYNVSWPAKSNIAIEHNKTTLLLKYNVDNVMKLEIFKLKGYNSKKLRNSFNISKIELLFKEYLMKKYNDSQYQYKSELYPYSCDFYINDYDLYIEIQGNWTHGKHPYDEKNKNDLDILNKWNSLYINECKYGYKDAINVWTIRDVLKRNTAILNNLNYLEIFTCKIDSAIDALEKYLLQTEKYKVYIYDK